MTRQSIERSMRKDAIPSQVTVHTSLLFDSKHKKLVPETSIEIDTKTGSSSERNNYHLMTSRIQQQLTFEATLSSQACFVERIVRATIHAKAALEAGYTTYRDLGTEGLGDADVHFRDTINRGIIPGPRMFVATECIASSNGYEIRQENGMPGGTTVPRLSDSADGVIGVRAAVRRRLGAGADVIKFYADYRRRTLRFPAAAWPGAKELMFPPSGNLLTGDRNPSLPQFTQEEMNEIVAEAERGRAPVAAHSQDPESLIMAANAGVTSIEHGFILNEKALQAMKDNNTIFVPTLSVLEAVIRSEDPKDLEGSLKTILRNAKAAYDKGVKLACGGDTGAFPHGENAREMELMVEAGIPVLDVLQAATLHGWESCGGDLCGRRFGSVEEGWAADLVALDGNPADDIGAFRRVKCVMKDGKVYK